MESPRVVFIIPAYNEEITVAKVINSISKFGSSIVIDDASYDKTAEVAKTNGAIVITHSKNLGYDKSLNSGFKIADKMGFKFAITLDADQQHDTKVVPKLLSELFDKEVDIVAGVRVNSQRFSEYIFKVISKYVWGLKDPLCGLKGYRMDIYKKFGTFDTFNSIGTELLIRASIKNKKISQINVNINKRIDKPRFGNIIYANYKIFKALLICLIKLR